MAYTTHKERHIPKLLLYTYVYILNCKKAGLNLTFIIPNCLKYRNKGKDYNNQTQQYFMVFLKYIITIWATCFDFY